MISDGVFQLSRVDFQGHPVSSVQSMIYSDVPPCFALLGCYREKANK